MATIHDIARLAECSARTVSRVFNNSGPVRSSTRERVLAVAAEMNYRPNQRARGLRTGRSNTIGVIQNSVDSEVNRARLETMTQLFSTADYSLLINRARSFEHELELLERMQGSCDAMVIFSDIAQSNHPRYDELLRQNYPFMLVDPVVESGYPAVMIDRAAGYCAAVVDLAKRGRSKIALVLQDFRHEPRLDGYRDGLAASGLTDEIIFETEPSFEGGKKLGAELVAQLASFDALLCHNDRIALGIMQSLQVAGVAVPQQVAVMGFDNDRYSAYTTPALSSVEQGTSSVGRYLYEQIHANLEEGGELQTETFSTSLICRDST